MTDRSVLMWLHDVLGVGTLTPKKVKGNTKLMAHLILNNIDGVAHFVMHIMCVVLIWPFAHTKVT